MGSAVGGGVRRGSTGGDGGGCVFGGKIPSKDGKHGGQDKRINGSDGGGEQGEEKGERRRTRAGAVSTYSFVAATAVGTLLHTDTQVCHTAALTAAQRVHQNDIIEPKSI